MIKPLIRLTCVALIAMSLQGCLAIVGGAALGAAGAAVIYDHRDVKTLMSDETISRHISMALQANDQISSQCHVVVSTYHGIVLLAGQAPTQELKNQIQQIARQEPNIKKLYNQITIEGPTSMLTRSSDAWITTKVKTALLNANGLKSGQFKVVTENGTVYLLGIVSRSQAEIATNAARTVGGVQKVVTAFQYQRYVDPEQATIQKANIAAKRERSESKSRRHAPTTKSDKHKTKYIAF